MVCSVIAKKIKFNQNHEPFQILIIKEPLSKKNVFLPKIKTIIKGY